MCVYWCSQGCQLVAAWWWLRLGAERGHWHILTTIGRYNQAWSRCRRSWSARGAMWVSRLIYVLCVLLLFFFHVNRSAHGKREEENNNKNATARWVHLSVNSFFFLFFRIFNLAADCVTQLGMRLGREWTASYIGNIAWSLAGGIIKIYVEVGLGSDRIGSEIEDRIH